MWPKLTRLLRQGVGALSILYVTTLALALATSMCMYWVLYTGGKQWKFCALAIATAALMALAGEDERLPLCILCTRALPRCPACVPYRPRALCPLYPCL